MSAETNRNQILYPYWASNNSSMRKLIRLKSWAFNLHVKKNKIVFFLLKGKIIMSS